MFTLYTKTSKTVESVTITNCEELHDRLQSAQVWIDMPMSEEFDADMILYIIYKLQAADAKSRLEKINRFIAINHGNKLTVAVDKRTQAVDDIVQHFIDYMICDNIPPHRDLREKAVMRLKAKTELIEQLRGHVESVYDVDGGMLDNETIENIVSRGTEFLNSIDDDTLRGRLTAIHIFLNKLYNTL